MSELTREPRNAPQEGVRCGALGVSLDKTAVMSMIYYMSKSRKQESKMPATRTPVPAEFMTTAATPNATAQPMATDSQLEWIGRCRAERVLTDEMIAFVDAKLDPDGKGITRRRASELLDRLFALPRKSERATTVTDRVAAASPFKGATTATPDIPSGRYALRNEGNLLNDIEFYSVYRFEDGGLSLKRFASDTRYPVKGALVLVGDRLVRVDALLAETLAHGLVGVADSESIGTDESTA
jgi:hypothetical protein